MFTLNPSRLTEIWVREIKGAAILNSVEWVALISRMRPLSQWRASFRICGEMWTECSWDISALPGDYSMIFASREIAPIVVTRMRSKNQCHARALIWESLGAWISTWQVIKSVFKFCISRYSSPNLRRILGGVLGVRKLLERSIGVQQSVTSSLHRWTISCHVSCSEAWDAWTVN